MPATTTMDARGARHLRARLRFQAGVGDRIELVTPLDELPTGEWGTVSDVSPDSGLQISWDCGVVSVVDSTTVRFRVYRD
jgi:hypothetical protein